MHTKCRFLVHDTTVVHKKAHFWMHEMSQIPKGYKQSDVGVIPEGWEICELSEAVDFLDGQRRPIKSNERSSGEFPYYGASGIIDYVDDYIFNDNLILLGEDGENILSRNLPLAFQVSGQIWVNNHAHVLKPKDTFDITFLTDYLESLDYSLLNSGTAQPKLNKQSCLKIKILKPSKPEQETIAGVLSDADALISSLERLIDKKQKLKQGAMQHLLTPKPDWEVKKLGELCDVRDGTHESPKYYSNGVPFVTSKNIINGKLDFSDISFISEQDAKSINQRSKVDKGDILMSMIGTVGNAVLVTSEPDFCIKNVALLKPKKIEAVFLVQQIISPVFQVYINSKIDGGIQKFVSLGVLRELDISIPKSKSEQTRIAAILSDMDEEIGALESKLSKYRQIKQALMSELLTGRIRLV
jgi:type I restriction enzyme, S subunit